MSYVDDAFKRARRGRSPWNLLLIPACILCIGSVWWAFVALMQFIQVRLYPAQSLSAGSGVGPILATVAPLFAAMPIGMLLANRLGPLTQLSTVGPS